MMAEPPLPAILEHARPRAPVDLMNWPWFSLAKTPRAAPIHYQGRRHSVLVTPAPGAAAIGTIWDADILFWATSQLVQAQDEKLRVVPTLIAPTRRILRFLGRDTGHSQYERLAAALARLAASEVTTSIGTLSDRPVRFRWIEAWQQTADGILLTLPEWLLDAVRRRRVLAIDPGYFTLTGGVQRWLWLLARKHAGQQSTGWRISFDALHARSGSATRHCHFVAALPRIAQSGRLLTYRVEPVQHCGNERLSISRWAMPVHSAALVPGDKPGFDPQLRGRICE